RGPALGVLAESMSDGTLRIHKAQPATRLPCIMHCSGVSRPARFRTMRTLDSTDFQLLIALSREPRATNVSLADELGLSRNTVQVRMAQLERSGVFLAFDRRIDPAAAGYPLTAFITVHVQQQK